MGGKRVSAAGELAEYVRDCAHLRRAWRRGSDRGPFVIFGRPDAWSDALEEVRGCGAHVIAFHDRFLRHRRPFYGRRPVIPGRWGLGLPARWLFAGRPRKRFFDAAAPALNRCLWQVPLSRWRQHGRHDARLLDKHGAKLGAVMARLADGASRATYASLIRGRLEGDVGYFSIASYPEYDHPVVRAAPGDVIIDGGAYSGDSARRFAWRMRGLGTIVAMEPDVESFAKLGRRRIPGLRPVQLGVWGRQDVLSFSARGPSGKIKEDGTARIGVASIDSIVESQRLRRVDLIKLDVEGAERQALDGAQWTLRRWRPKLQVSIYHQPHDLFEIPLRLMEQLPNYAWYVGHHGPWHTETDLYGMPRERKR